MKFFKYFLILTQLFSSYSFSQEVRKGFELMELFKIAETYRLASDLSFNMQYTYADSAQPNTILEKLDGAYRIHNGKYQALIDSVEYVQGGLYNLAVSYKDSIIAVGGREEYTSAMQIPMMDSLFRDAYVADMSVTKLNDSTRIFRIQFQPEGPYCGYEMQYDPNTFLIRKVTYYMPEAQEGEQPISSGVVRIDVSFSRYSFDLI